MMDLLIYMHQIFIIKMYHFMLYIKYYIHSSSLFLNKNNNDFYVLIIISVIWSISSLVTEDENYNYNYLILLKSGELNYNNAKT